VEEGCSCSCLETLRQRRKEQRRSSSERWPAQRPTQGQASDPSDQAGQFNEHGNTSGKDVVDITPLPVGELKVSWVASVATAKQKHANEVAGEQHKGSQIGSAETKVRKRTQQEERAEQQLIINMSTFAERGDQCLAVHHFERDRAKQDSFGSLFS